MPRPANHRPQAPVARVNQRLVLPLILAALVVLGFLYHSKWSRAAMIRRDRQVLDEFHIHGNKTPERDDIIVLGIDEASITGSSVWDEDRAASPALRAMQHPFPWPRRVWAEAVNKLAGAGARMVFLDLAFAAPGNEEDDRLLRDAVTKHEDRVILGAKFDESNIQGDFELNFVYPNEAVIGKDTPDDGTWGFLNFWPDDSDEIVRKARFRALLWKLEKQLHPRTVPDPDEKEKPSIALTMARKLNVSASAEVGEVERLRFCEREAYPPLSLFQIFVPDLWHNTFEDGSFFKGKTVFIGAIAQELQDIQRIPLGQVAGVQLHAHALTALLSHSFLKSSPAWMLWASLLGGALFAWLAVTFVRQPVLCLVAMWAVTAGAVWLAFVAFNKLSLEVSPMPFSLAINGCGLLGFTGNFLSQLRESRKLSRFIQRYHSPDRVAHLLKDRQNFFATLGGVERSVTILFSDVRGYTSLSEGMKPEELVTQLNEYLSKMVEKVFVHHGSIDKFIGDAVMALWGSMPDFTGGGQGLKHDALDAVTSALAMREALDALNADWRSRDMPELRFGIGIHQGPVVVGNIGSAAPFERMELTVIGDSVNLASRLEGVTKEYGVDLIISEAVQKHVKETFLCRSADLVQVKGKALPVEIFTVISRRSSVEPRGLVDFELGIIHYRAGRFTEALEAMDRAAAAGLNDELTAVYQDRCRALIATPPENWNGVYKMTKK